MKFSARLLASLVLLFVGVLITVSPKAHALAVDFRKPTDTISLRVEYFNENAIDQTTYIGGLIEPALGSNLASASTFEVSEIKNTYPLVYTAARGLTAINSGDAKTTTTSVKASDAVFVNSQNQLSFVLTPNNDNRCGKITDVKGCVWDIAKKNQWDPDTLSCLGGAKLTCDNTQFNGSETNKLTAGMGGYYDITLKIKGTVEKEVLSYFPTKIHQFTPGAIVKKSNNIARGLTVFLTDRAVASLPNIPSLSLSSSSSSVISSSVSSSSISSVVSSSSSSSVAVVTTPRTLTRTDISTLDVFCKDGVVGSMTTCSFTTPVNTVIPSTLRLSVDTLAGISCVQSNRDVECKNVTLPATVGAKNIFITIDTVKTDTLKKVTVFASSQDLVRSGVGSTSYVVLLVAFTLITMGALIYSNRSSAIKNINV